VFECSVMKDTSERRCIAVVTKKNVCTVELKALLLFTAFRRRAVVLAGTGYISDILLQRLTR